MRVAILGTRGYPYVYSGYETMVRELAERLVDKGVSVTVYCHKNLFTDRPEEKNGIQLVYIPTIETKSLSQLIHSFFSMTHACLSDADVILMVNSANGPFGVISRIFRKPTAINVDGMEWLRPKWKGLGARYFKWSSKQATKWYDQIINDSDEMRRVYLDLFDKDSEVIAYGANIRFSDNYDLIKKWKLLKDDYYLIVGRLIPDNNADLIIKGFLKTGSKRKLVIVGDVPYQDVYADGLKSLTDLRLIFTGYVNDQEELAELYHNAYAYFHGHEFGGTNPTMLKAMAYGSAILALDTVFNREMLQNGKYGVFFDKSAKGISDIVALAEKDAKQIEELKANSRDGLIERYDWDIVTEQYLNVFQKLSRKKDLLNE